MRTKQSKSYEWVHLFTKNIHIKTRKIKLYYLTMDIRIKVQKGWDCIKTTRLLQFSQWKAITIEKYIYEWI